MGEKIIQPPFYNSGFYDTGAAGGGLIGGSVSPIITSIDNNGVEGDCLVVGKGVFSTQEFEMVTSSYELDAMFYITSATHENGDIPIVSPTVHYKSIDIQFANGFDDLFFGMSQDGNSWYNWDTENNKRSVHLSDYGLVVNKNEWHRITFSFTVNNMKCWLDGVKILDKVILINPTFAATKYNIFANFDSVFRTSGKINLNNFRMLINGNRVI